ncbi:16S rRNA (cytosine(1402)-N(4))-methyltransferase RsmH [Candidatus Nomurabacteria bacterium]|uniref:Ribosomal RNA small subunit methyltransferase H n=1 Tax=Candidatus Dojkabacteria bacterium TaxID=2099670 RepID=A0A955I175_9BACT|nr:16S rRNA (cytosine(1402)-N(4))-methyltransferase RsmH [Candidatus Dojkabacteria bacterium]MCB9789924.1 16S rRNA (cytosine(1402)-N(4))-methyltransferase RsmH [Candidatus Nomurabacteria bacterium]MCB9803450.1 16S rRNA (cytosine(1402)-N(4))-methyltransferase RsmH [Candidatus Nomurabacteria bacterium]
MSENYHIPVLLSESIEFLITDIDGVYVDCTLGEGGHSKAILEKLSPNGRLISLDQDPEAIEFVNRHINIPKDPRWKIVNKNFEKISEEVADGSATGILMDIGFSSRQIDIPGRGFSFHNGSDPLDMRMSDKTGVTASDLLNALDKKQLARLFFMYGEERRSNRIAEEIKRSIPINTVEELNQAVNRALPAATAKEAIRRVYQALRIAVNDELHVLEDSIGPAFSCLRSNGRLVIITFHSLEDRIVKRSFRSLVQSGKGILLTKKPMTPSDRELETNPRSHSAKMRVIEKI